MNQQTEKTVRQSTDWYVSLLKPVLRVLSHPPCPLFLFAIPLLTNGIRFQPYKTSNPSTAEVVNRVEELSKKKGVSMAQIAIAWSLAQDPIAAPIVGTTSLENLKDIIGKRSF